MRKLQNKIMRNVLSYKEIKKKIPPHEFEKSYRTHQPMISKCFFDTYIFTPRDKNLD